MLKKIWKQFLDNEINNLVAQGINQNTASSLVGVDNYYVSENDGWLIRRTTEQSNGQFFVTSVFYIHRTGRAFVSQSTMYAGEKTSPRYYDFALVDPEKEFCARAYELLDQYGFDRLNS